MSLIDRIDLEEVGERLTADASSVLGKDILVLGVGSERVGLVSLVENVIALGAALEQLSQVLADATSSGGLMSHRQDEVLDVMQRMLEEFHTSALLVQKQQAALEGRQVRTV